MSDSKERPKFHTKNVSVKETIKSLSCNVTEWNVSHDSGLLSNVGIHI